MNPLAIYQSALDAVSQAVLANDFSAYLARMDLPYLLVTLQAEFILHTPADLEPTFRNMAAALASNGATHYERVAREAQFVRPDRIEGQHFTHIIADGERVTAPWGARQALVKRADGWKFSEARYPFAVAQLPLTEDVLRNAIQPPPEPLHLSPMAVGLGDANRTGS